MAEVDYIQKEKKQGMNYSIVSHDAVTAKVRPILQKHGVVYYPRDMEVRQNGNRTEALFTVRFENADNRDDYIDVSTFGYGVDPQDKGPGKAMSYGVKYALLKVLGLETGDDPDEVQDSRANYKAADPTFIDDAQYATLVTLIENVGADTKRFCKYMGVRTVAQIAAVDYDKAVAALQAKARPDARKPEPVE